jgi:hypothetical protein
MPFPAKPFIDYTLLYFPTTLYMAGHHPLDWTEHLDNIYDKLKLVEPQLCD